MADPKDDIERAERLYEALVGRPQHLTRAWPDVQAAYAKGNRAILVELPWNELRDGERLARHQVIVERIAAGRVHFINPLKTPAKPGAKLGGPDRGPERRLEPDGRESMPLEAFVALFARGGKAMLEGR